MSASRRWRYWLRARLSLSFFLKFTFTHVFFLIRGQGQPACSSKSPLSTLLETMQLSITPRVSKAILAASGRWGHRGR
ncbi:hypothetical protein B0H13DRAFT_1007545 [Mycena leptocephala]|nr:hypothetical protein B0H13DRAFT_1007545 [Mycena leptocephala]